MQNKNESEKNVLEVTGTKFDLSGSVVATQDGHSLMAAPSGSGLGILPDDPTALASRSMKTGYVAEQFLAKAKAAGIPILHLMPETSECRKVHKGLASFLAKAKNEDESQD